MIQAFHSASYVVDSSVEPYVASSHHSYGHSGGGYGHGHSSGGYGHGHSSGGYGHDHGSGYGHGSGSDSVLTINNPGLKKFFRAHFV